MISRNPRVRWFALLTGGLLLLGGGTTVLAMPVPSPDPCDALTDLREYAECRLDRIESGIPVATVTKQPATVTATATVTVTANPPSSSGAPSATPSAPTSPAVSTIPASSSNPAPVGQPLISREGERLMRAGVEWKFVGMNAGAMFGCWAGELQRTTDANLNRYFSELSPHSMTRIFAYAGAQWQSTLPRIVAAAERNGQYLMLTLSDANDAGQQCFSNKGPGYPSDGGAVLAHAKNIVPIFKDSPAVAVWEIVNEGTRDTSAKVWYQTIGKEIKRLDPNTLVASGASTCYKTDWSTCVAVDDWPENDLVSFHEYDWNNGAISHWADETQAMAKTLGKPWFTGETGFCCGGGVVGQTENSVATQMKQEFSAYLDASGCAGMMYWDFKWAYNNAYTVNMGDPAWAMVSTFRHNWQGS